MAANPLTLMVIALAAVVAGLIVAYQKSETFRAIVDGALRAVGAAGQWLWNSALKPAFDGIKAAFEAVGKAGTLLWENALRPAFKLIADVWLTVVGVIVHGAATAFGWVPGVGPKLKAAAAEFDKLRDRVDDSLDGIGEEAERYGSDWAMGLARGIAKNQDVPISTARGVANRIAAATRAAHDSHSPSRVADLIGRQWDQGLASGVEAAAALPQEAARRAALGMAAVAVRVPPPVVGSLDSAPASVRAAAVGAAGGTGRPRVIQLEAPLYLEGREIGRASRRFSLDEEDRVGSSGFVL
jgi:hypothetical protein